MPTEEKRRRGTLRADRITGPLTPVPPLPPSRATLSASEALEAVLTDGVGWLASTDAPSVALLREAVEDYARLRKRRGALPKDIRDAREQVARLLAQLGFDPTARARLGLAEVKAISKLEELRAQRAR